MKAGNASIQKHRRLEVEKRMRYLVVTGGSIRLDFAKEYLEHQHFDKVIAVDLGLESVRALQLVPDLIIGDFDSVSREVLAEYEGMPGVKQRRLCPEKDLSDTQAAVETALMEGAAELVILGGTGTRLDHVLANIHILMKPLAHHVPAYLIDECNKIYLVGDRHEIARETCHGKYVSLFPITEKASGVSLQGLKYGLQDGVLTIGDSLGVSNELVEDVGVIHVRTGILIVVESRDRWIPSQGAGSAGA